MTKPQAYLIRMALFLIVVFGAAFLLLGQYSLLVFLGLLGTFWGLLETVQSIGNVISGLTIKGDAVQDVFERLKSGLQAPLAGMGTAFSSSLFGLAGSLVLGYLALQAGQAQNRFYNDLEEWLSGQTRISGGGVVETVNSRSRLYPSLAGTNRRQSGKPTADFDAR